jgi:hypothetical protein
MPTGANRPASDRFASRRQRLLGDELNATVGEARLTVSRLALLATGFATP